MPFAPGVQSHAGDYYAQGMGALGAGIGHAVKQYQQNKAMAGQAIAKFEGLASANKDLLTTLSNPDAPNVPKEAAKAFAKLQKDGSLGVRDAALLAQYADSFSKEKEDMQRRALQQQQAAQYAAATAESQAKMADIQAQRAREAAQRTQLNQIGSGVGRGVYSAQVQNNPVMQKAAQMQQAFPASVVNPEDVSKQMQVESSYDAKLAATTAARDVAYAKAEAAEANAALRLAAAENKAGQQAFADTSALRKEFVESPLLKNFQVVDNFLTRGEKVANQNTAAGDIALLFSYMKVLDPTSVVREGEYATAENAASVPQRVRNIYQKAIDGERLQPKQREEYLEAMREAAQTQHDKLQPLIKQYDGLATKRKFDSDEVVSPYYREWKPSKSQASSGGAGWTPDKETRLKELEEKRGR